VEFPVEGGRFVGHLGTVVSARHPAVSLRFVAVLHKPCSALPVHSRTRRAAKARTAPGPGKVEIG